MFTVVRVSSRSKDALATGDATLDWIEFPQTER